jgi:hypothetical protein
VSDPGTEQPPLGVPEGPSTDDPSTDDPSAPPQHVPMDLHDGMSNNA